ncbi:hypothetical protein CGMCC3_g16399 [Colletotrichum fructicola]|uniref:Vegetative incompatibility protein HET-E-1 n=1 Tax=Colletotrichum fructicola (strain Nara gc5) TaxID=1213859 RepID=A0A7J6IDW6_COLFN|nr:uncharacterized protein CGMCC3_g16399 [Colletotrichum fructicola]KAE9567466.1 hypothetical protein CGMCC3_g16399 [Colletotrichum fructicola]KAF4474529.1 Vegetative incompatibility protein HET-E-1 [Colletotrichum fructicola Nara gc5]
MADTTKYTVGWICALPTEFNAAKAFLDEKHEDTPSVARRDNNSYALGRIGCHNVVVAVLPDGEYGTTSAAVVAQGMLHSFPNVRIGLMVGIGGGAPSSKHDVRLGDIVVSSRDRGKGGVFQYDFGKLVQNQDVVSFEHTDFLDQPPMALRTAVNALKGQYEMEGHQLNAHIEKALAQWPRLRKRYARPPSHSDRLYQSSVPHPNSVDECDSACSDDPTHLVYRTERDELDDNPAIHYGLIASSNQLMKNATIRDNLAKEKGVLCFEMEAAGLMNHFPCLVIRGICDYSDSHKNKNWQGFAAMTAAAYATDLLRQIPPNRVEAEKPIGAILGQIQEDLGCVHQDVIRTKAAVIASRNDQHVEKLRRWLSPADPSTNAMRARERRHAGTGSWLLQNAAFREWEAGQRQHLWLCGLAGCGKTVLSTIILDHLEQTGAHLTLRFFFDFNDIRKQKLEDLLRSLAFQLYHASAEAAKQLDNLFISSDKGRRQPDVSALSACVESMLQSSPKVAVILDALDECTMRRELIYWIGGLSSSSNTSSIKLIVTGRPEAEFQRELPRLFGENNCKLLKKKAVNADIRSYVDHELNQRPDFKGKEIPHDLLGQIRSRVGDGAEGMFRWAACQLDSLAKCLHPQAIRTALSNLPRDLNETYQRMLQSIPPELKDDAFRLLQFLVHAKRPLTIPEAVDVIATLIQKGQQEFNVERRLLRDDDILYYCPSLVSIVEVTRYGKTVREVQLAHFSVKEYLVDRNQFTLEIASSAIATTCFTYIRGIDCSYPAIRAIFPLAQYAAEVTMELARFAEVSNETVQDTSTTPLLCFYVNAQGGEYGNALQAASYRGHQEIVKLLLNQGADVNAQGGGYGNALQAASYRGHQEIIQLLLNQGADVKEQTSTYRAATTASTVTLWKHC